MIHGEYPCCNGAMALTMPDNAPGFAKEDCPHCGAVIWHWFSRVDPMSYTEAGFLARFDVDDETRSITPRLP